jgi:Serine/threonine protein phosphatase
MEVKEPIGKNPDEKTRVSENEEDPGTRVKRRILINIGETGKPVRVTPKGRVKKTQIRVGNIHNIGARESQQDAFGLSDVSNERLRREKGVFAVVADGMGGLSNGAEASAFVTSYMLNAFSKSPLGSDISQALLNMAAKVNEEVVRYLSQSGNAQSGSTVVAVIIKDGALSFVSVGDSRIYLQRGGAPFQVNRDHNYASELDEKAARGEITYEEANEDPQRDALTSYIGMNRLEKVDRNLKPIQLIEGDRVIIMTDGVYRTVTDEEIRDAVKLSAEKAALKLEDLIASKHKTNQDNFTAVILECL